jgi:hypothetical protein
MKATGSMRGAKGSRYLGSQVTERLPMVLPEKPRLAATNFFRPVWARANFKAASLASVPELVGKTRLSSGGSRETKVR